MAGFKKENKNRKSLIAENRFKNPSKKSSHKNFRNKKKSNQLTSSRPHFLIRVIRKIILFFVKIVWSFAWRASLIISVGVMIAVSYYFYNLKEFSSLLDERSRGSVTLKNSLEEVFAWRGDNFAENLTANNISPHLKNAILATEDRRFYTHFV